MGMITFTEDFLASLRDRVDLREIIGNTIPLKRSSKASMVGCCPFHSEKTPSFSVKEDNYHCFGCGAKGDAITWKREYEKLSFFEAVKSLADQVGLELPKSSDDKDNLYSLEESQEKKEIFKTLNNALFLYQGWYKKSEQAQNYLKINRGLTEDTINNFSLGVVGTGLTHFLKKYRTDDELIKAGLGYINSQGNITDRFRNRIMIPIHNDKGNLIGFAGRALIDQENNPKYLNSPETTVFHKGNELYGLYQAKESIRKSGTSIVVEGYFDVISTHQNGEKRTVAPMGTAITHNQINKLFKQGDNIVFAFDGDKAGKKAALRACSTLLDCLKDGQTAKFLFLPNDEDPDSYIKGHGIDQWNNLVNNATPLSTYLISYVKHNLNMNLPESVVFSAKKASAILNHIDETKAPIFKQALSKQFEDALNVKLANNPSPDISPKPDNKVISLDESKKKANLLKSRG